MPALKRKLKSFDLGKVKIDGGFWKRRLDAAATGGLMDIYSKLQQTGRLDALKLTWKRGRANKPQPSWDCDVAKWLQTACCVLQQRKAPKLETLVGKVAKLLAGAQQKDGYINSYITTVTPTKRWKDLTGGYELDFAANFISAAVAHYETTDSKKLLKAAEKFANHLASVFDGAKKLKGGYSGNAAIESALIKLARATKKDQYTALAGRFVELRSQAFGSVYKRTKLCGDTAGAMNLLPGTVDVATQSGDTELLAVCNAIWKDLTLQKMYITGGAGRVSNDSSCPETSDTIALVQFAHRMFQVNPDSKYTDFVERALYNTILAARSASGWKYFDTNPLASNGQHRREKCFSDATCAPDLARFLNSFGDYVFSTAPRGPLYVNLYAQCTAAASVCGMDVKLQMRTDYPWNGKVNISVAPAEPLTFSLMLRIPSWARKFTVCVNGKRINNPPRKKGYAQLRRQWATGDEVQLELEMPIERITAHPRMVNNIAKTAIHRGPLVYCIEQCDYSPSVRSVTIGQNAALTARLDKKLFGGAVVIEGKAFAASKAGWGGKLYRPAEQIQSRAIKLRAIPYYLWDNRSPGPMAVWIPEA